ncbi:hypothetical protein BDW22DRAFT_1427684 [Trametopsis cervina]|nr:hypothetical protein BDW22DRAFT_1427684 [Trametopsis cervina]
MHFLAALSAIVPSILLVSGSPALQKRARLLSSIVAPSAGSVINPGETFSFQYSLNNWCEGGYTPISLWLLQDAVTSSSLNSSEQFDQYIYHFGDYLYPNFGLPAMTHPPPPPATFTMPALDPSYEGQTIYFAAIQTENSCPPDGHLEYGVASTDIQYGTA